MLDKLKQLMEVKNQVEEIKRELENLVINVNEANGIEIAISADQRFRSIEIDRDLLVPEKKNQLENDLLRSINVAVMKSQKTAAQKMKDVTGMNIPGL